MANDSMYLNRSGISMKRNEFGIKLEISHYILNKDKYRSLT